MGLSSLRQRDLVLVLVLVIMVTSSAIELTGDNVCHRVENYTVSLKESYVEPVIVNTFAWCLAIPPRCPKTRVEMRERWRIKTETRQRNVSVCCEGYVATSNDEKYPIVDNSDIGKCEPRCDACEHGRCIAPNTCRCNPGRRGDDCAHECLTGTWGEECSRACDCQLAEKCDPVDGKCHCPPGWQGSGCKDKCTPGLWGVDCALSCACKNETDGTRNGRLSLATRELASACHHVNGSCMNLQWSIVPEIMASNRSDAKETIEANNSSSIDGVVPRSITKSTTIDYIENWTLRPVHGISYANDDSEDEADLRHDPVVGETREFATESPRPIEREIDYQQRSSRTFASNERGLSETSSYTSGVFEIGRIETSTIATRIDTNEYGNYKVERQQRVERIDTNAPRVKKPSTPGPIVAVVHVSGNGSPNHDGSMIMTSVGADKIPSRAVPMPLDIAALIVIGSILLLGLTTLAVLAILHIRSKLFETIRLSIYDAAEKRDTCAGTLRRNVGEKGNSTRISSIGCNSGILACEYETPRCMVPEHRTLTRPRPPSSVEVTKKPESSYSNDYPNIRLFGNLQELLEAHYDRPPSTFRQTVLDVDAEHVYDEIPLQSSTTFATSRRNS